MSDTLSVEATPVLTRERVNLELMLSIGATSPETFPECFQRARGYTKRLKEMVKHFEAMVTEAAIDHIELHGDFAIGETRFYTGLALDTRCRDARATAQAILEVADVDTLLDCLSATAIKQGAAKRVEGLDFNDHFEVVCKEELREGRPKLELLEAKPKYLKIKERP
jgi:microsomal dipeptidase-like Zn-dependent dipeptidase